MGVLRKTKSVREVISTFEKSTVAVSAVDLVERFSTKMNKTTVYRILERLEEDGVIHSFMGGDGLRWYAACSGCNAKHHHDAHPHTKCSDCGKVTCLEETIELPNVQGFQVNSAEILLIGRCEKCAE
jgi:Fur family ferric uptake transcriptional regulator